MGASPGLSPLTPAYCPETNRVVSPQSWLLCNAADTNLDPGRLRASLKSPGDFHLHTCCA